MKIANILKKATQGKKLHLRKWDYIRSMALTETLKEMEKKGATVIGGSISTIVNRDSKNACPVNSFTTHAKFIYNDIQYYIEYSENYFFDDHIMLSRGDINTYYDTNTFNALNYLRMDEREQEAITKCKTEMLRAIANANMKHTYKKNKPKYMQDMDYTIYVNGSKSFNTREG